jgi:hypothetical protein
VSRKPIDKPIAAMAEEGEVIVDGPDGVAFSIAPDIAADLSDQLLDAAAMARGQQLEVERLARERRNRI